MAAMRFSAMTGGDMNAIADKTVPIYEKIVVEPQAVHIGAEISGVDLGAPLDATTIAEIRAALLQWKVIFFRDQPLSHAQHVAFGDRKSTRLNSSHVSISYA